MKKIIVFGSLLACFLILMISTIGSISLESSEKSYPCVLKKTSFTNKDSNTNIFNFKLGLVFGSFESIEEEDGLLAITTGEGKLYYKFLFCNRLDDIWNGKKIKISEGKIGIITDNFIFAFCRIFMTRAQISMDIVSHDEQGNKVTWEVTEITGDSIWGKNMRFSNSELIYGPLLGEYLTAGDQIEVTAVKDGIHEFIIYELISRDVLFSSGPVKY